MELFGLKPKTTKANSRKEDPTLADLVDKYVAARKQDRDLTIELGDKLPRKQLLSQSGFSGIEAHLKTFQIYCGDRPLPSSRDFETVLDDYRNHLLARHKLGEYSAWTVNTKLSKLNTFVKWLVASGNF